MACRVLFEGDGTDACLSIYLGSAERVASALPEGSRSPTERPPFQAPEPPFRWWQEWLIIIMALANLGLLTFGVVELASNKLHPAGIKLGIAAGVFVVLMVATRRAMKRRRVV